MLVSRLVHARAIVACRSPLIWLCCPDGSAYNPSYVAPVLMFLVSPL
jgi:hypothetical protein